MCSSVRFARSGHVGAYMRPQTSNQMLQFGGLGVWTLCSQCSGLCSLLSIQPVCCCAACGLSVLHTECCTSQWAQRYADAVLCYIYTYSSENQPFNYVSCRCSSLGQKVKLFVRDACQKWDLTDYLVAARLSFLQGSEHSSSSTIPSASTVGTKSPLCAYGSWLEHTELWNCIWTMGFSFLSLLFVLTLTPLCFHAELSLTPELFSSTLPPFSSLLATTQAGHYCIVHLLPVWAWYS